MNSDFPVLINRYFFCIKQYFAQFLQDVYIDFNIACFINSTCGSTALLALCGSLCVPFLTIFKKLVGDP